MSTAAERAELKAKATWADARAGTLRTIFYDDPELLQGTPRSIFLAGPTATNAGLTSWRQEVLDRLTAQHFAGTVILPEFRDGLFATLAPRRFSHPLSHVRGMRDTSYNILAWETAGIERATLVLFWMPFHLADVDDPASLPGFTTRAEVSREIARDSSRIVLGMPPGALSGSHIRYHAHQADLKIHATLAATIDEACWRIERAEKQYVPRTFRTDAPNEQRQPREEPGESPLWRKEPP